MRTLRRLPLSTHAIVELALGLGLVVAALALDLSLASVVALFASGVLLAGLGLSALDEMPVATHESLDGMLVIGLSIAAAALALAGEATGATVLLAAAATELVLTSTTRWTRPAYPSYGSAR